MKLAWITCNAFTVVATLVCMSYLYYACRPLQRRLPVASMLVIAVTALISGLQFAYPELLAALRRDPQAIRDGEIWRMITALFVQPNGMSQVLANGFLMLAFLPAAERLYGWNVLIVYFAAGLVGQVVNHLWDSGTGGSSTAIFGVMGSLLVYILRNRSALQLPFVAIAGAGLLASLVMIAVRDGHGVGLLTGALVALVLPPAGMIFRNKATNRFEGTVKS